MWHLGDPANDSLPFMECDVKGLRLASANFEGRTTILALLYACFGPAILGKATLKQIIFVIFGLGGVGKTQITYKFVDDVGSR